jgi:hypothetical protein
MSLINERYDRVVCISLKEREDKYKFMLNQFIKHNIEVEWYRPVIHNYIGKFSELYADKYNKPEQNLILFNKNFLNELSVMQSFYHVVKNALIDGVESLFIFEDDFQPHKDWDELLPKYFEKLPQDADLIMLYSYQHELFPQNIRVSSRWIKAYRSWSNIAVGMNKRYLEEYIKQIDNCPRIGDLVTYQLQEKLNCYIACPVLGIPSKQFISNIRGNNKNYENPLFQNAYTFGLNERNYE